MSEQDFYDIHEQTKYYITISRPENPEDLSDCFVTQEELENMVGERVYHYGHSERKIFLSSLVTAECVKWAERLEASGKKTLKIDDEELLDVLRKSYFCNHMPDYETKYGRHGDRICYTRRYKRVKKRPTKSDVRALWSALIWGWHDRFNCYPAYIPVYDRHLNMFAAFKKIVGWRRVRRHIPDDNVKFIRQIWDNPEEFIG